MPYPLLFLIGALLLSGLGNILLTTGYLSQRDDLAALKERSETAATQFGAIHSALRSRLSTCESALGVAEAKNNDILLLNSRDRAAIQANHDRQMEALREALSSCDAWATSPVCRAVSDELLKYQGQTDITGDRSREDADGAGAPGAD